MATIILLIAAAIALAVSNAGVPPAPFGARACQGSSWRRSFPDASKHEIRQFLSLFTGAFAFGDREKLKFNPNDQLLDIYRALYPCKWQADALEFETLRDDLQSEYGITFSDVWREGLTLAQLFQYVRQTKN